MPAQSGSAFLLKISDGASPPAFQTVAGLRTTQMSINGDTVVVTHKGVGRMAGLAVGCWYPFGIRQRRRHFFSEVRPKVRCAPMRSPEPSTTMNCPSKMARELRGRFLVQRLDYAGDFNGERKYTLQLESSGPVIPA